MNDSWFPKRLEIQQTAEGADVLLDPHSIRKHGPITASEIKTAPATAKLRDLTFGLSDVHIGLPAGRLTGIAPAVNLRFGNEEKAFQLQWADSNEIALA
jgi:hypothetical protein